MTTFLCSILPLTAGADRIMHTDPHGWTLTLVSVSVVFCALIILYGVYSLSGAIFSHGGEVKKKVRCKVRHGHKPEGEVAAAIAVALNAECNGEVNAAIATALHLYLNDQVHDIESGVITIKRPGAWAGVQPRHKLND